MRGRRRGVEHSVWLELVGHLVEGLVGLDRLDGLDGHLSAR